MAPRRRSLVRLVLSASLVAVGAAGLPGEAAAGPVHRYVALGDSYAAVGSWTRMNGNPVGCLRAGDNYPADVARRVGAAQFVDVTCSAATTEHMTRPQVPNLYGVPVGGLNAPQFDALTPDTDLVSATLGGDDIDFSDILQACARFAFADPRGHRCTDHFTAGGVDRIAADIDAVAPKIGAVLDDIHARSPRATVVLAGYLPILPSDGGSCFPQIPVAAGDAPYLRDVQRRLNDMLAATAAQHGSHFADPDVPGRDACQPAGANWLNPVDPHPLSTWPFHPNATGQAFIADRIVEAVR
ncbi:SGNH/GDSL hydrolase family protein [Nocardia mexicana]|nr:SGNH/GDSL hydrolase family protein [Nocardia mexicana]